VEFIKFKESHAGIRKAFEEDSEAIVHIGIFQRVISTGNASAHPALIRRSSVGNVKSKQMVSSPASARDGANVGEGMKSEQIAAAVSLNKGMSPAIRRKAGDKIFMDQKRLQKQQSAAPQLGIAIPSGTYSVSAPNTPASSPGTPFAVLSSPVTPHGGSAPAITVASPGGSENQAEAPPIKKQSNSPKSKLISQTIDLGKPSPNALSGPVDLSKLSFSDTPKHPSSPRDRPLPNVPTPKPKTGEAGYEERGISFLVANKHLVQWRGWNCEPTKVPKFRFSELQPFVDFDFVDINR